MLVTQTRRFGVQNAKLRQVSANIIKDIQSAGTYKVERVIDSPQEMEIVVNGKKVLNFCANNYLGLSNHPRVLEAA